MAVSQSGGHKKLTRCMIDDKIPGELEERYHHDVVDGNEVLWIVGGRINERYKITSETGRYGDHIPRRKRTMSEKIKVY